jgi:hypothetical protein
MKHMKQVILVIFLCIFFMSASYTGLAVNTTPYLGKFDFSPQDVVLQDDAFHGQGIRPYSEWWYFDSALDNGYSTQMSIRIVSALTKGYVFARLDIYRNGSLLSHHSQSYPLSALAASKEQPVVQIKGKTLFSATQDANTGQFLYNTSFEFSDSAVHLQYIGCTKGWKGQLSQGEWWGVFLPRANVTGTIAVNNILLNVTGTGYHDHNWEVNGKVGLNFGWFWGKVNTADYTITWSTILPTRITRQPLMVVNIKNAGYIPIPTKTIWFSVGNIGVSHLKPIPLFFNLETMTNRVFCIVNMEVIDVQYERFFGFLSYWRYHVKCTGTVMVDGLPQTVDGVFIAEYLRFH